MWFFFLPFFCLFATTCDIVPYGYGSYKVCFKLFNLFHNVICSDYPVQHTNTRLNFFWLFSSSLTWGSGWCACCRPSLCVGGGADIHLTVTLMAAVGSSCLHGNSAVAPVFFPTKKNKTIQLNAAHRTVNNILAWSRQEKPTHPSSVTYLFPHILLHILGKSSRLFFFSISPPCFPMWRALTHRCSWKCRKPFSKLKRSLDCKIKKKDSQIQNEFENLFFYSSGFVLFCIAFRFAPNTVSIFIAKLKMQFCGHIYTSACTKETWSILCLWK